ncbi:MAG TPA: sugar phosphate isomerase/epimerase [Pyrodictium sp.]|nr:sugar phosphate isomerase/epimerase [Pyrodictium sp.]
MVVVLPSTMTFLGQSLEDAIESLYALGFKKIEVNYENLARQFYPLSNVVEAFRNALERSDRLGVEVPVVHLPYEDYFALYSVDGIERLLNVMSRYNVRFAVLHPINRKYGVLNVELARKIVRLGEEYGVKISFENLVSAPPWSRLEEIAGLVEDSGATMCLDVGHAHINGYDVAKIVEKYSHHISVVHLHDNSGSKDEHLPPGAGTIDWLRVFQAIRGKDFVIVLEVKCEVNVEGVNACRNRAVLVHKLVSMFISSS